MREIFNFLNFGKKRNIEVSKILNFGNLKKEKESVEVDFTYSYMQGDKVLRRNTHE